MVRSSSSWLGRACSLRAVAVAASVASGIFPGAGRAETKIVVGIVSHGTSQWPQYVAEELGWFKQRGLALDMVSVGSGGAQQLAAGAIDLSHSGFPEFIRAANQGAHVKMVINDISVPPYTVFAKPAIKGIADLRSKTISIGGIKDVTLIYIKPLLASAGLSPSDVDFVYAKAAGDRFSALAGGSGRCGDPQSTLLASCRGAGLHQSRRDPDLSERFPVHGVGGQHGLGLAKQAWPHRLRQGLSRCRPLALRCRQQGEGGAGP